MNLILDWLDVIMVFLGLIGVSLIIIVIAMYIYGKMSEKPSGKLHVETSDPDGPYIFLELYTDVADVSRKKRVMFEVDLTNYISRD